jgi:hypothetical protein
LQVLDVLTTMAFLLQGVSEANPVVRFAIETAPSAFEGLLLIKLVAIAMAVFCVLKSRDKLLRRVNIFFACLVAYNLVALILASVDVAV